MYFRSSPSEKTRLSHMAGVAYYNQVDTFEVQQKILDPYLSELKGKRGVFLPGGIGRLTNYAISKGIDAHCLDLSKICEGLCKKYYPDVPFIRADMSFEREGFDFAFMEDLAWHGFSSEELKIVVNWQKVCTIYPKEINYKVIRFNSSIYEKVFAAPEEDLQRYFDKQLNSGVLDVYFNLDELDDYVIEEHTINTNNYIGTIEHLPDSNYKFLGIGNVSPKIWNSFEFSFRLHCSGYRKNFATNSRHIIQRTPQEIKPFPWD